ncbi:prefoldin subunit 6-like [Humulus lupulus]|uniref:prefoldin subunit 6-like n=1 Tax=Humulus lupulus TaxID=3486 RepID=UPI002B405999|nr:prefoldin subunit 6-like [Humulus lupulus]
MGIHRMIHVANIFRYSYSKKLYLMYTVHPLTEYIINFSLLPISQSFPSFSSKIGARNYFSTSDLGKFKSSTSLFQRVGARLHSVFKVAKDHDGAQKLSDISKNHQVRKKYTIQLGENELVLKLDILKEDANVYKLIAPVLVKQELAEANANVRKRIEYISAELKQLDGTLQDLEEKQNSKTEAVYQLERRLQRSERGKRITLPILLI